MSDLTNPNAPIPTEPDSAPEAMIPVFGRVDPDDEVDEIADEASRERAFGSLFGRAKKASDIEYAVGEVSVETLRTRLSVFMTHLDGALKATPAQVAEFAVESVTITVEVNAKGSVTLLGVGGETGAKGGLAFTLKRQPTQPSAIKAPAHSSGDSLVSASDG